MANDKTTENRPAKPQGPSAGESAEHSARSERKPAAQTAGQPAQRSAKKEDPHATTNRSSAHADAQSVAVSDQPRRRRPAHRSGRSGRPAESEGQPSGNDRKPGNDRSAVRNGRPSDRGRKSAARREPASAGRTGGRWTWRDYALQFSVVFLGVLITFIGSGIVERWRTQRTVRTVMQLVYEELKTNRDNIERTCRDLEHERRGIALMQECGLDYTRVPVDSLDKYQFILAQMSDFTPQKDALEMLRSSETMTAVGDKQLLFEVLGCYTWITRFAQAVDSYNSQKMNALNHLFASGTDFCIGGDDPVASWKSMMDDPMCAAFIGVMGNFFGRGQLNGGAVAGVDRVTAALNEKYRFE